MAYKKQRNSFVSRNIWKTTLKTQGKDLTTNESFWKFYRAVSCK